MVKINALKTFVWYATHPKNGQLVLITPLHDSFKEAYIYCPRMIFERLGRRINPAQALELNLGPLGFVPRPYYEEAGFMVPTPMFIRIAIWAVSQDPENTANRFDEILSKFILEEWKKVYKSN